MSQNTFVHSRKKLWIISGVVIIILAALVVLKMLGVFTSSDQKAQAQTHAYNNSKKEAVVNNGGTPAADNSKGSAPRTPYTPPTNNDGITITPSTSGDTVVITTKLVGYSDGTCTLDVTNGAKTNTQTANVIYAPNYSTCAGFTVPKSSLGSGNWNIALSVLSGGNTTSKTVTYEVAQ